MASNNRIKVITIGLAAHSQALLLSKLAMQHPNVIIVPCSSIETPLLDRLSIKAKPIIDMSPSVIHPISFSNTEAGSNFTPKKKKRKKRNR